MMRKVLLLLALTFVVISQKTFYDTPTTYARYRHWIVIEKGILMFQFNTYKENALLFYTDGGQNSKDFLKLQLVNQKLVVHTNFGSGTEIFLIGENLSNGVFHSVRIQVERGLMTVVLDNQYSKEQRFDNSAADNILQLQSPVFIGGVNNMVQNDLVEADMALEPRFSGCIQGLKFTRTDGETLGTPSLEEEEGTVDGCEATACDSLSFTESCRNSGLCEPEIDNTYVCNCEGTGYFGEKCTKAATVAKFQASEYIRFNNQDDPMLSKFDSLSFRIKTSRSNGLVFYYKTDNFFMAVEVVTNQLSLNVGFGTAQQLVSLDDPLLINDNEWHIVHIGRYESFITLEIDGLQVSSRLANPTPVRYNKDIFIGGGESLTALSGVRSQLNFVGCLQQVTFNKMQMLKEAKSDVPGYSVHGRLDWMCTDIPYVPVMFGSSDSRLELDTWLPGRDLSLQFRTSHPDGVIAFTGDDSKGLALQLVAGELLFKAYKGGQNYEAKVGSNLADSNWHSLTARHDTRGISLHLYGDVGKVKQQSDTFRTAGGIYIQTALYLGDAGEANPLFTTGYRGCIRGFSMQHEVVDLYTKLVTQPPGVMAGCGSLEEACSIQPCYHGSVCKQEMNSFTCDCTGTGYEGTVCSEEASSLTFGGDQYLRQVSSHPIVRERDTISFRFRTQSDKGLLMFITTDQYNDKYLYFDLISSKLYVIMQFGRQKFFSLDQVVSDGRWHVVVFTRVGSSITLRLDSTEVKYQFADTETVEFPYKYTYLGKAPESEWRNVNRMTKSRTGFDGCLQQVRFNGVDMIQSVRAANVASNARLGCKFQETTDQQIAGFVRPTYLRLPPWRASNASSVLTFQFRTMEPAGLVLFHGDVNQDYVAVELENGRLKTSLQIGDGSRTVSSLIIGLNDNEWHNVLLEITPSSFTFEVDEIPLTQPLNDGDFSFTGGLYLGGIPENVNASLLPPSIQTNPNLLGCVKALIINQAIQDLLQAGNGKSGVRPECDGTCAAYPCQNGGTCRQTEDRFDCVCSGTFYKGKTCSEDMAKVRFTPGGSLTYTLYDSKTTIRDDLHIMFKTTNRDGGLVQIETGDPNQYIKVVVKESYLELTMNIGQARVFARSRSPVNDDEIHTLSFWRRNRAVSYSFDEEELQSSSLSAAGTLEFGVIMNIKLSFTVNSMQFSGCVLGLDYNGITPLEDTSLPNIKKVPGILEGSCDAVPVTDQPVVTEDTSGNDNDNGDNNNNTDEEDNGDTGDDGDGDNTIDVITKEPSNDNTTMSTHRGGSARLGLPIILVIALGGFICILAIVYGVSRFAKRRQGVYRTNEDKRLEETQRGRGDYDKLTIHDQDQAFELPTKRELYM